MICPYNGILHHTIHTPIRVFDNILARMKQALELSQLHHTSNLYYNKLYYVPKFTGSQSNTLCHRALSKALQSNTGLRGMPRPGMLGARPKQCDCDNFGLCVFIQDVFEWSKLSVHAGNFVLAMTLTSPFSKLIVTETHIATIFIKQT